MLDFTKLYEELRSLSSHHQWPVAAFMCDILYFSQLVFISSKSFDKQFFCLWVTLFIHFNYDCTMYMYILVCKITLYGNVKKIKKNKIQTFYMPWLNFFHGKIHWKRSLQCSCSCTDIVVLLHIHLACFPFSHTNS